MANTMTPSPITSCQIDGDAVETVTDFTSWTPESLQMVTAGMKLKDISPWKKSYDQPRQLIKKQRHYFVNKCPCIKTMVFPVVVHGCESWTIKKAKH